MNLCEKLRSEMSALFACKEHGNYVRVRTPFLYPDGDVIDVFLRQSVGEMITITDLGESLRWLRLQTISARRSPKQRQLLNDICVTHGIELFKGQLVLRVQPTESLAFAVTRLAQGCLRVADLWFTFRTRSVETVTDEVADSLVEREIPFERGETLSGRSGKIWRPDFHVRHTQRSSLAEVDQLQARLVAVAREHGDSVLQWAERCRGYRNEIASLVVKVAVVAAGAVKSGADLQRAQQALQDALGREQDATQDLRLEKQVADLLADALWQTDSDDYSRCTCCGCVVEGGKGPADETGHADDCRTGLAFKAYAARRRT